MIRSNVYMETTPGTKTFNTNTPIFNAQSISANRAEHVSRIYPYEYSSLVFFFFFFNPYTYYYALLILTGVFRVLVLLINNYNYKSALHLNIVGGKVRKIILCSI